MKGKEPTTITFHRTSSLHHPFIKRKQQRGSKATHKTIGTERSNLSVLLLKIQTPYHNDEIVFDDVHFDHSCCHLHKPIDTCCCAESYQGKRDFLEDNGCYKLMKPQFRTRKSTRQQQSGGLLVRLVLLLFLLMMIESLL